MAKMVGITGRSPGEVRRFFRHLGLKTQPVYGSSRLHSFRLPEPTTKFYRKFGELPAYSLFPSSPTDDRVPEEQWGDDPTFCDKACCGEPHEPSRDEYCVLLPLIEEDEKAKSEGHLPVGLTLPGLITPVRRETWVKQVLRSLGNRRGTLVRAADGRLVIYPHHDGEPIVEGHWWWDGTKHYMLGHFAREEELYVVPPGAER